MGKKTSSVPICMGRKKLPKAAGNPGMMNKKIMMTPWRVKAELYISGVRILAPGCMSSSRIRPPRQTATRNQNQDPEQVHQADALVVGGEQPGPYAFESGR